MSDTDEDVNVRWGQGLLSRYPWADAQGLWPPRDLCAGDPWADAYLSGKEALVAYGRAQEALVKQRETAWRNGPEALATFDEQHRKSMASAWRLRRDEEGNPLPFLAGEWE